jgi:hypothetical protein
MVKQPHTSSTMCRHTLRSQPDSAATVTGLIEVMRQSAHFS